MIKISPVAIVCSFIMFFPNLSEAEITLPGDFFVEKISHKSCAKFSNPSKFEEQVSSISGIPQSTSRLLETGSADIAHEELSTRWLNLLEATYYVAANKDNSRANIIVSELVYLAKNQALLDSPTPRQARTGGCWSGGSSASRCDFGALFHITHAMTAILISSIVLEEYMEPNEKAEMNRYLKKVYNNYLKPMRDYMINDKGIYEFADLGLATLAYARWINDKNLAEREINERRAAFLRTIEESGLIDNSSYRGLRGYWYHTHNVEIVLGYALVARNYGVDFFADSRLGVRLKAVVEKTVWGGSNINEFLSLPDRGTNANYNKEQSKPHMHQVAVNLPSIIKKEFSVEVPLQFKYRQLVKYETVSRLIGFNVDCLYGSQ